MNKILYTACSSLFLLAAFSSCEMKDELLGSKNNSENQGELQLNISNDAQISTVVRSTAEDNGIKPGVFPAEEVNVNNYTVVISDNNTDLEVKKGLASELGSNGNISLSLEEGGYTVKAYNYDGSNVNVSTRPYFLGTSNLTILPGTKTTANISCKLQNIEVAISLDQSFKTSFNSDYEITVDNGAGAIQIFTSENINTKYYFAVPEDKSSITVSIKANTAEDNQLIQRTYTVTKPADSEGNNILGEGDAFIINLTEDGSTSSYVDFGMSVDFSFAEKEEVITIPAENITFTEQEGESGEGDNEEPEEAITFIGLPETYTNPGASGTPVVVTINAKNGIANLFVTISSTNQDFMGTLQGFGLAETFDIANPGELEAILTGSLEDGEGIGLLKPGQKIKGETSFVFDVTEFMKLLPLYGSGENVFSIEVVDTQSISKGGDLKVNIE